MPDPPVAAIRAKAARMQELAARLRRANLPGAEELEQQAREALEIAGELEALTGGNHSDTSRSMVSAARARISAGRSRTKPSAALIDAANKKGHTLRSLADAVQAETGKPCPQSIITRAMAGHRPIRRSAARVIQRLTGYAATPDNWPGGWSTED